MPIEQLAVYVIGPVVGYLLGSIPFALVIGLAHGVDIRTVGSRNIGATNLGRTLGKRYFLHAFLLDAGKGFVPTLAIALLVQRWNSTAEIPAWTPLLTACACVLGHLHSVFLKFRGGKGVATSFGVIVGFWPLYTVAGLGTLVLFLIVFLGWRYISLASIAAAAAFPLLVLALGRVENRAIDPYVPGLYHPYWNDFWPQFAVACGLALMIIWKHRANIARLHAGTELKAGRKA
jgi:glycerol-3-phosphate acyltransferase PlsY